jgi:hypothetical protein
LLERQAAFSSYELLAPLEFGMILQEQGLLEVGFERYEVHVGDSFCFDSTIIPVIPPVCK